MPSINIAEQERVHSLYNRFKERGGSCTPENDAGFKSFSRMGYPGRKAEMFTYVNTGKLGSPAFGERGNVSPDKERITSLIYPGFERNRLIITDGLYNEKLSDISALSATITRRGQRLPDTGGTLKGLSLKGVEEESDPFAALNAAFVEETLVIDLHEKSKKNSSLQILFHSSEDVKGAELTFSPRLLIKIPAESELEIVARFTGSTEKCFVNGFQEIELGRNSTLHYIVDQSDSSPSPLFMKSRVTVEGGATCLLTGAHAGGKLSRFSNEVILAGEEALFESRSTSVITGQEEAHLHTLVSHRARDCKSSQYFNNIVLGKGRASVDTTVEVQKSGGGAQSGQLVKSTLLSNEGRADSKPNLRIFADDVKCQHGATTGCLDERQIFYMQSRGISRRTAQNAIIAGLVESMLTHIRNPELRKSVRDKLVKKIEDLEDGRK